MRRTCVRSLAGGIVVVLFASSACSSGDSDLAVPAAADTPPASSPAPSAPPADAELAGIAFSASSAAPFDRVAVTGLGDELQIGDVGLWMRAADQDIPVPVYVNDDGAELVVPFHPTDPLGGGPVEMYFERDAASGPTIAFDIGELPRSDGAWNEFLDEFAVALDLDAIAAGSSGADLESTDFADVLPELLPLKFAQSYLDDGTENSLVAIYDSDELTDDHRVLLDALVAGIDVIDAVRPAETPNGLRARAAAGISAPAALLPTVAVPQQTGDGCRSAGITVDGPADLAAKLNKANKNTMSEGDSRQKILEDIAMITTVGSVTPIIGPLIGGTGALFKALETYLSGTAGMHPSRITSLDAQITTDEFLEDFAVDGFWSDVMVVAESTGWQADVELTETLFAFASKATSKLANLTGADRSVLGAVLFLRDNAASKFAESADGALLSFCPEQWEVDVTGQPWSNGSVVLERFETDSERRVYRPADLGLNLPVDDTLRIELNFLEFRNQMVHKDFPIRVVPIRVTGPEVIEVDNPTDLVEVEVSVAKANDATIDWNPGSGGWQGEARLLETEPARWTRTHVASPDAGDFPYLIVASSASTGGLRADRDPPRVAVIEVRLRELIVSPNPASVLTGRTLQFSARDRNGNPVDVEWSATGGTIDDSGLYTAGDSTGTYTVTAVDRNNPKSTATVSVEVVDGDCVVGAWRLREQAFLDQLMAFVPNISSATHDGGQYVVEFADNGGYTGSRQGWTIGAAADQGTLIFTIDSQESGTWNISGGVDGLILAIVESTSNATVTAKIDIGGQFISLPSTAAPGGAVSGRGPFTCASDVLTLTIVQPEGTIVATLDRIG